MEHYYKGEGPAVFVGYCRRQSCRQCFVKFSGSAAIDPVSGDVFAFGWPEYGLPLGDGVSPGLKFHLQDVEKRFLPGKTLCGDKTFPIYIGKGIMI